MAFDTTQSSYQEQAWIEKYRAALDRDSAPSRRNPIQNFLQAIQTVWSAWRAKSLEKSGGAPRIRAAIPVLPEPVKNPSAIAITGAKRKQIRREKPVQKSGTKRAAKANKAS
jgi:hypothetical protein